VCKKYVKHRIKVRYLYEALDYYCGFGLKACYDHLRVSTYFILYWNLYLCGITVFHQCLTGARTNEHKHEHYITIDLVSRNVAPYSGFQRPVRSFKILPVLTTVPTTLVIERDHRSQRGTRSYGSSGPGCVPSRC
jgi:hypothetical protein